MIFKQLFRSKHQNPDPQVRLQAIEKLDKQVPEQKSILHELAFNDADIAVSLAALDKLDSFVLWYKMAEIAKNDRVQKKSKQYVENTLLCQQSDALNQTDKRQFILELRDPQLLEKLLQQPWVQHDLELATSLVQKLDKPQVQEKLLFDSNNEQLKYHLLKSIDDSPAARKLLNKIIKKSLSVELKKTASEMMQDWLAAEEAPKELERQVTMVLSRLLALKDHGDLLQIQQQQLEFNERYSQLGQRFDCLSEIKRNEIEQKHAQINQRVERNITLLQPKWQAEQASLQINQSIANLVDLAEQNLQHLSTQLESRIAQIEQSEIERFAEKISHQIDDLHQLTSQVPSTEHGQHRQLEQLNNQLVASLTTLNNLPKFQQAMQKAEEIMAKFTALEVPTDVSQIEAAQDYLREQKNVWHDTIGHYQGQVPKKLSQQWNKGLQDWQRSIKSLKDQVLADVSKCRNKLRAVESLINQGKFKSAMGLYQKVHSWFDALPEQQQSQLERSFIGVKEQIENLKDWQEYIAAPRKPALLSQIETLADNPLEIDAQSETIKSLRYQWNSLGKSDTEADIALNEAFELAIEKAFAPCRAFYERQQLEREQNLQNKQKILKEVGVLGQQEIRTSDLAKNLRAVQQKWRNIGEVDFKFRNEIYEQYQQLLAPLKEKVAAYYEDNAEQKRKLVDKAARLVELDSVNEAIDQAKLLQQKWKTIEHAGKKAEKELWAKFRHANDSLFAKRTELNQREKLQLKEQISQANEKVSEISKLLHEATSKVEIQNALQGKQAALDAVDALPARERSALGLQIQNLVEQQQAKLADLSEEEKSQQYKDLFSVLQAWQVETTLPEGLSNLSKFWVQCFEKTDLTINRQEITIKMEVVAQVDSPKQEANLRQTIQMQLMAHRLQGGDSASLVDLLKEWVKAGPLNKTDLAMLKRIEPLFLGNR